MSNQVEFNPELVRMAQYRVRDTGVGLTSELARLAAEELVLGADPEHELLLDSTDALSSIDSLQAAFGVNEIVVNGTRIDVRALDSNGAVSAKKALIGTPLLSQGTLIVRVNGCESGEIIGYLKPEDWLAAEDATKSGEDVTISFEPSGSFDALSTIKRIAERGSNLTEKVSGGPSIDELKELIKNRRSFIPARQKQMLTALCFRRDLQEAAQYIEPVLSNMKLDRVLRAESTWNRRTDEMVDTLSTRFKTITREDLKKHVLEVGEQYGGQPQAPAFRKAVLKRLASEELASKLGVKRMAKAVKMAEQMLSGKSAPDAVKHLIENKVAVDIAIAIKSQRKRMGEFMTASAEEIGQAFGKLALQPSYATHSSKDTGVESINEALDLLAAGDVVAEMMELESELIGGK